MTKQGCVNFRNIQNVYLQSSVECLIDVWKGHEYTFSFKIFLLISYDPLEVNTFPSLVIHRQNHGGYKYVVLNLNHIQDDAISYMYKQCCVETISLYSKTIIFTCMYMLLLKVLKYAMRFHVF